MKKPPFTAEEYATIGQHRAPAMAAATKVRNLISIAYGVHHPMVDAIASFHDRGLDGFYSVIEDFACQDWPAVNFADHFRECTLPGYAPPPNLPGLTIEETATLATAIDERRHRFYNQGPHHNKKTGLTVDELHIIKKCLGRLHADCDDIVQKIIAHYGRRHVPAARIEKPVMLSRVMLDAYLTVSGEIHAVSLPEATEMEAGS